MCAIRANWKKMPWITPDFMPESTVTKNVRFGSQGAPNSFTSPERCMDVLQKAVPSSIDELVVNKTKLKQIESVLLDAYRMKRFVLITGSSGCGKSISLSLIAKKMGFSVVYWQNSLSYECQSTSWQNVSNNSTMQPIMLKDQCSEFFRFLASSQKASRLSILRLDEKAVESKKNVDKRRIIVVDDYPPMLNRKMDEFRSVLFDIKRRKICAPIIFVCNLHENVVEKSNNALNFCRLFSDDVLERLNFLKVNMNPITNSNVLKCLKQLTIKCGLKDFRNSELLYRTIAERCNGDLRSAILNLEFYLSGRQFSTIINADVEDLASKDFTNGLFSCLGKFLYSKRMDNENPAAESLLPPHISQMKIDNRLSFDPEVIIDQCGLNAENFVAFLHENCLPVLCEKQCPEDLDIYFVPLCEIFSISDLLSSFFLKDQLQSSMCSLVARSVAFFANFFQKISGVGYTYRQVKKPHQCTATSFGMGGFRREIFDTCSSLNVDSKAYVLDLLSFNNYLGTRCPMLVNNQPKSRFQLKSSRFLPVTVSASNCVPSAVSSDINQQKYNADDESLINTIGSFVDE